MTTTMNNDKQVAEALVRYLSGEGNLEGIAGVVNVNKSTISRHLGNVPQWYATALQWLATERNGTATDLQQLETERNALKNNVQRLEDELQRTTDEAKANAEALQLDLSEANKELAGLKNKNWLTYGLSHSWTVTSLAVLVAVFDFVAISALLVAVLGKLGAYPVGLGFALSVLCFSVRQNEGSRRFAIAVSFVAATLHCEGLQSLVCAIDYMLSGNIPQNEDLIAIVWSIAPAGLNHRLTKELQ